MEEEGGSPGVTLSVQFRLKFLKNITSGLQLGFVLKELVRLVQMRA